MHRRWGHSSLNCATDFREQFVIEALAFDERLGLAAPEAHHLDKEVGTRGFVKEPQVGHAEPESREVENLRGRLDGPAAEPADFRSELGNLCGGPLRCRKIEADLVTLWVVKYIMSLYAKLQDVAYAACSQRSPSSGGAAHSL